ncbi:Cytosol aminopeptidase [Buchnera aphidicola (Tetraneura ulmi)]|uniref:leucyl aminopeptidase n=1 Tax=Buchnera aphidicola TaxID=9 RepID=UPI003463F8BE
MKYFVKNINFNKIKTDCIILGIFKNSKESLKNKHLSELDIFLNGKITILSKRENFFGNFNQTLLINNFHDLFFNKILLIGCGNVEKFDDFRYEKIIKNSIKVLNSIGSSSILFFLNELNVKNRNMYWKIRLAIKYIEEELYFFSYFKKSLKKKKNFVTKIIFNSVSKKYIPKILLAIKHGVAISEGIKISKDISNLPANICTPIYLSNKSRELFEFDESKFSIEVLTESDLKKNGMNAYLAVGSGSKNKSLMTIIKYKNSEENKKKPIVLVGKGVTFDSGGISLKPSNNMHRMKYDMAGAASIYGILFSVMKLSLPINVIGVIASCENMLSGCSFRPGDVLTTMSKKTVEVLNTDAEGRLLLCDVLTYVEKFQPDLVIDIATLTGACIVALGTEITGLMSNNSNLSEQLLVSGKQSRDKVWELPILIESKKDLYSSIADIANISKKGTGGAITAAYFLSQFCKKYKWAHLDIAGTAYSEIKDSSTGRPVDLLVQFLLNKCTDFISLF